MSVRELQGKFTGIRVQRTINGKVHLKHYSFKIAEHNGMVTSWRMANESEKDKLRVAAQAYDKQLAELQKSTKEKRPWKPASTRTNTGVKGVAYRYGRDGQGYIVEGFWISVYNNKQHSAVVRLTKRTWSDGWKAVVKKLNSLLELKASERQVLLSMCPPESLRQKHEA
jgi:hypothetical protein